MNYHIYYVIQKDNIKYSKHLSCKHNMINTTKIWIVKNYHKVKALSGMIQQLKQKLIRICHFKITIYNSLLI